MAKAVEFDMKKNQSMIVPVNDIQSSLENDHFANI